MKYTYFFPVHSAERRGGEAVTTCIMSSTSFHRQQYIVEAFARRTQKLCMFFPFQCMMENAFLKNVFLNGLSWGTYAFLIVRRLP